MKNVRYSIYIWGAKFTSNAQEKWIHCSFAWWNFFHLFFFAIFYLSSLLSNSNWWICSSNALNEWHCYLHNIINNIKSIKKRLFSLHCALNGSLMSCCTLHVSLSRIKSNWLRWKWNTWVLQWKFIFGRWIESTVL